MPFRIHSDVQVHLSDPVCREHEHSFHLKLPSRAAAMKHNLEESEGEGEDEALAKWRNMLCCQKKSISLNQDFLIMILADIAKGY